MSVAEPKLTLKTLKIISRRAAELAEKSFMFCRVGIAHRCETLIGYGLSGNARPTALQIKLFSLRALRLCEKYFLMSASRCSCDERPTTKDDRRLFMAKSRSGQCTCRLSLSPCGMLVSTTCLPISTI